MCYVVIIHNADFVLNYFLAQDPSYLGDWDSDLMNWLTTEEASITVTTLCL
jgi:hypothetical protein